MHSLLFYLFSFLAVAGGILLVAFRNPVSSALSMVLSFVGLAGLFIGLNAYFVGIVQILVYAGAIMVLFVFVIMMLNLGEEGDARERGLLQPKIWAGPALLSLLLFAELLYMISTIEGPVSMQAVTAKEVGLALFGPYVLAVEIASMLLLAGLVGSYHLGRRCLEREV